MNVFKYIIKQAFTGTPSCAYKMFIIVLLHNCKKNCGLNTS